MSYTPPRIGQAYIATASHKPHLYVEMGATKPTPLGGFGGFTQVQVPGARALTRWPGWGSEVWSMALRFDNLDDETSVEADIDTLIELAGRGSSGVAINPLSEPPHLIVDTAGLWRSDVTRFPGTRWVINDFQVDPPTEVTNTHGHTIYAEYTIQLLQYTAETILIQQAAKAGRITSSSGKVGATRRKVKAKHNDTVVIIARRELGDASRWPAVAALNPKYRDPHKKIPSGTTIKLP